MSKARLLSVTALALSLGACASLSPRLHTAKLEVRPHPLAQQVISPQARADAYYQDARAAIERREYATALQLLQAARDQKADDVRVLNGFGVVYDKLGRFDLSARYYAQAQALDPSSTVVANNMAYSAWLQDRPTLAGSMPALAMATPVDPKMADPKLTDPRLATPMHLASAPDAAFAAAAPPAAPNIGGVIYEAPGVVRLMLPSRPAPPSVILAAGYTGRPLVLVNASGRSGGAEPVRLQLVSLGWSAPEVAPKAVATQARSTIRYPARDLVAARALARTLPMKPTLVACADDCRDISLYVGRDAVGPQPGRPARRKS